MPGAENNLFDQLGQPGQDGQDGENGENGADGQDGVSGYEVVGVEVTLPAGEQNFVRTQTCPDGKVAVGGGFKFDQGATDIVAVYSKPAGLEQDETGAWVSNGWEVKADNNADTKNQVIAYAICVAVASE